MKGFEVLRRGGNPGKVISKRAVANRELIRRVRDSNGPPEYEYKRRGAEQWSTANTVDQLYNRVEAMRLSTGDAIFARRQGARAIFVLRAVEVIEPIEIPPIPDGSATDGVKRLWNAIFEETAEVERILGYELVFVYQGIFNCRLIDGTSIWSQHAWRNGLDWHLNRKGTGTIDTKAMDLLVDRIRGVAAELLWRVAGHYGHAHGTGDPKRSGTPACA